MTNEERKCLRYWDTAIQALEQKAKIGQMTNGDVIKAMFPKREVIEHDTYIEVAWGEGMDEFDKVWWNSPYEPQERSE